MRERIVKAPEAAVMHMIRSGGEWLLIASLLNNSALQIDESVLRGSVSGDQCL